MASRLARTTVLGEASPCPSPKPKDTIQSLVDDLTTPDAGSFKEKGVPSKATKIFEVWKRWMEEDTQARKRTAWRICNIRPGQHRSTYRQETSLEVRDGGCPLHPRTLPSTKAAGYYPPATDWYPKSRTHDLPSPLAFSKGRTVFTRRPFGI
ncbi:hypothetical protein NMY22_g1544 [Coprinellus aureogranulatus]|nr:hypothetical protein NMY22_g1544 [Coprinellus aureogranulatus]